MGEEAQRSFPREVAGEGPWVLGSSARARLEQRMPAGVRWDQARNMGSQAGRSAEGPPAASIPAPAQDRHEAGCTV